MAHGGAGLRARSGRLLVKKRRKDGREYVGQNSTVISGGMMSGKEMERELALAADEHTAITGEEVVNTHVDVYKKREPIPMNDVSPTRVDHESEAWGGFQKASWLPESPTLRRIKARREG